MYLYKSDEDYTKASRNLGTSWSSRKYFTTIEQFMENDKDIYTRITIMLLIKLWLHWVSNHSIFPQIQK